MRVLEPEILKSMFIYSPDTGDLKWNVAVGRIKPGDKAGCLHHSGRLTVSFGGKMYQLSRVAWAIHYGIDSKYMIDHINQDPLDNRIENLREVTSKENSRNQRIRITNKTGITGVHWCNKNRRWSVMGYANGIRTTLGMFSTIFDAAACRRSNQISEGFHANHGKQVQP